MAREKTSRRYLVPYKALNPQLMERVDDIKNARLMRLGGALAGVGGAALTPTLAGMAGYGAVGTVLAHRGEKAVIASMRRFGDLVADKPEKFFGPSVITALKKEGATHAHVDRRGNIVFTKEPKYYGMEIIPHPLKLRWRMKVPLFLERVK